MMKRALSLPFVSFLLLAAAAVLPAAENGPEKLSVTITAELVVSDPEKAGQEIIDFCESGGGYYIRRSDYGVSLRYPAAAKDKIEEKVKKSGILLSYNVASADIEGEYLVLEKQLGSRENLMGEYRKLIDSSDLSSTISLERELMSLLNEMERIRGRLKMMENEYRYLKLDISFSSEDNARPEKGDSSFGWINRIDFYRFTGGGYDAR